MYWPRRSGHDCGPIALVKMVMKEIDAKNSLNLNVDRKTLSDRKTKWVNKEPGQVLWKYMKTVGPANLGAVTPWWKIRKRLTQIFKSIEYDRSIHVAIFF